MNVNDEDPEKALLIECRNRGLPHSTFRETSDASDYLCKTTINNEEYGCGADALPGAAREIAVVNTLNNLLNTEPFTAPQQRRIIRHFMRPAATNTTHTFCKVGIPQPKHTNI